MKKIPTIFKRNPENMREILPVPHEDCDWVFNNEGVVTRKYDGTCCLVSGGKLWKRREIKKDKPQPENFVLADYDAVTGKKVGWIPVTDAKEDRWHTEAFAGSNLPDGTYELCGPRIQRNLEQFEDRVLISHVQATQYDNVVRTFNGIHDFLVHLDIEGLVFHHPDGRMAKIKKRDYHLTRKLRSDYE